MATEIKTWQIIDGKLELIETSLAQSGRTETFDLEAWIASNPSIIGPNLAIVGRQVMTKSGPLDLLAIDNAGNTVIIELKRDKLPREALAQAIDYASDVADWNIEKISEICTKYTGRSLDDVVSECFPETNFENVNLNETQRVVLIGFAIEPSLERMINWLSDSYRVNVNAVLLKYTKTQGGEELLTRTAIISDEVEQERISRKRVRMPMSDDPGNFSEEKLRKLLKQYLSQNMYSAKRIRKVLLPVCLKRGKVTREQLKDDFVTLGEADSVRDAGYFLSLISQQFGMVKNDFLRQVVGYEYPNNPWEKDNYHIREEHVDLINEILTDLNDDTT